VQINFCDEVKDRPAYDRLWLRLREFADRGDLIGLGSLREVNSSACQCLVHSANPRCHLHIQICARRLPVALLHPTDAPGAGLAVPFPDTARIWCIAGCGGELPPAPQGRCAPVRRTWVRRACVGALVSLL
jgi:hypothetical protein